MFDFINFVSTETMVEILFAAILCICLFVGVKKRVNRMSKVLVSLVSLCSILIFVAVVG